MAGIDATTGRVLAGWPHVVQSIQILLTTRLGDRVMRRWVGAVTAAILGRLVNRQNMLRLLQSIAVAIELFEPRFRLISVTPTTIDRTGRVAIVLEGQYLPRGHLGDTRPEGTRRIQLTLNDQGVVAL
jgi:hypothetical protein